MSAAAAPHTRRSHARAPIAALLGVLCAAAPFAASAGSAPPFNLDGPPGSAPVSLAALSGKVVYVDFWASWCTPCRSSFPWMNSLLERYGERGLEIVAINLDDDPAAADAFLRDTAPRFTIAFDPDGDSAERYGVMGMPSSWLVDRDGQIAFEHIGFRERDRARIEAQIENALDRMAPPLAAAQRSR